MKTFKCRCEWTFVVGKKHVFGPIFEDNDASCARLWTVEEFREGYSDCYSDCAAQLARARKAHWW